MGVEKQTILGSLLKEVRYLGGSGGWGEKGVNICGPVVRVMKCSIIRNPLAHTFYLVVPKVWTWPHFYKKFSDIF